VTAFFLFDTSALVKRYHIEPGSDKVDEIFESPDNVLIISELALVEVASALLASGIGARSRPQRWRMLLPSSPTMS